MHSIGIDGLPQKFARSALAGKYLRNAIPVLTATAGLFAPTLSCASVAVYSQLSDWPNCAATESPLSDYNRLHMQAVGLANSGCRNYGRLLLMRSCYDSRTRNQAIESSRQAAAGSTP